MSELKQLLNIIDRNVLLRMAGSRVYSRGEGYFLLGKVKGISESEGTVTARVRGTRDYSVILRLEGSEVVGECDCPEGTKGRFCKHCVAVGLKLIDKGGVGRKKIRPTTMEDVRAWLSGQDKADLVNMLMNHAENDIDLRKQLLMNTARENPTGLDLDTFRKAIDDAFFMPGGYVDYEGSYDFVHRIVGVISSVRKLFDDGHAAEVVELAEYALTRLKNIYGMIDDSSGNVGSVMSEIQELHHDACIEAKPDPVELAGKLLEWEISIEGDAFYGAAAVYADVLGDDGLQVYRELVEAEWEKFPQLLPGQDSSDRWGRRYRISQIMQGLARRFGSVDDRVAVMARDLSSAYCYLQIAEVYKEAGNADMALEWAERGVAAFPERTDRRLRDFLAEEYHSRGRHDDAMALIWAQLSDSPSLQTYKTLKDHADRVGGWSEWRMKALERIREAIASRKAEFSKPRFGWGLAPDNSTLVEVFLWENEVECAWNEAQEGGCNSTLWMELAQRREDQHPEDSLRIYKSAIEPLIQAKNNGAYASAVDVLSKVNRVMARLGRSDEFRSYLASVRAAHKPKRNFTKMIDETRWLY